jgi:hypothetical protein
VSVADELSRRGELELIGQRGERRVPWSALIAADPLEVELFQSALKAAMLNNPGLEVRVVDSILTRELVVQWRPRRSATPGA